MIATLTGGLFNDDDWVFGDKYADFRMVAKIERASSHCTAATAKSSATGSRSHARPLGSRFAVSVEGAG
jgi:hypothetical protein